MYSERPFDQFVTYFAPSVVRRDAGEVALELVAAVHVHMPSKHIIEHLAHSSVNIAHWHASHHTRANTANANANAKSRNRPPMQMQTRNRKH